MYLARVTRVGLRNLWVFRALRAYPTMNSDKEAIKSLHDDKDDGGGDIDYGSMLTVLFDFDGDVDVD